MEEQLGIVREQAERKRTFEKASKAIRQTVDMIKKYADLDWFYFPPLHMSRDEILAYIHDNKLEELKLHIKTRGLRTWDWNGRAVNIKTADDMIEKIKAGLNFKQYSYGAGGSLSFDCKPDILQNLDVDLGDAFSAIRRFYHAHGILESYEDAIDVFDSSVLNDLKETIDAIAKAIFESKTSEHEIVFTSTDKTEEILSKLQNEIMGLESIQRLLNKLSCEICDRRLSAIQKEMFLKS